MNDPQAELLATLAAFALPASGDPNQHAQCRFPARMQWLRVKLGNQFVFSTGIKCPAFDAWTRDGSVSSLSVVFATGYLGNPASYFGHTLLKFNFRDDSGQMGLMDVSVNYGAIIETPDDPLTYMVKGVFGGYDGGFSHINFYFFNHGYGDTELRDLWEYRLNLPQDAVNLVVAHAWEVLGKRYTYYFFRRNCAYRMAEILQVVNGLQAVPENAPWTIPQALIQTLAAAKYQGRPVLDKVIYHPSRQSRFYEKFLSLSPDDRDQLKAVAEKKHTLKDPEFMALSTASQQAVLDALLDYYQFIGSPLENASGEIKQDYVKTLSTRYQLSPGVPQVRPRQAVQPHESRPPGWAQASWGYNSITGNALFIRVRPAYYDVLDADSGHVANAALSMGDVQLKMRRDKVSIDRVDMLNIESMNPGITGLPGDKGTAWKLRIGGEQSRLSCDDCLVARLQGDIGYGQQLPANIFGAIYIGGALQNNHAAQGVGYAKTSASLIMTPGSTFRMKLGYELRFPVKGLQSSYDLWDVETRWAINLRSDFRMRYVCDDAELLSMGIGIYW